MYTHTEPPISDDPFDSYGYHSLGQSWIYQNSTIEAKPQP